jgi:Glycosyltransferase family 87
VAHVLLAGVPLAVGTAVALLAVWRRWAPPVGAAVVAGGALRLLIAIISWRDSWQPPDFMYQFTDAIKDVLQHQDPLGLPNSEWHFLPPMAYVNAGAYRLGELIHLPWQVVGRVVPVSADVVLIALVGMLAGAGRRRRLAAFQYAMNPLPVMICAIHGQVEPVASALGAGALLLVMRSRPRTHASGALLGLAVAVNSWPALLLPGVLHACTGWRRRMTILAWACAVPLAFLVSGPFVIGYPARSLPGDIHVLLSPRSVIGEFGWTVLVTGGRQAIMPGWARLGVVILLAVLGAVWYLWRRADPVDLIAAMNLAFLASSDRVSAQYLVWPVPYQLARPARGTQAALLLCAAWDGAGYLWLSRAPTDHAWELMHIPWAFSSLAIVPFLVFAMPWQRRTRPQDAAASRGTAHPDRVRAAIGVRGRWLSRRDGLGQGTSD